MRTRARADPRQHLVVVPRGDDDPAVREDRLRDPLHLDAELVVERLVHLVEEQDPRLELLRDREADARAHPLRVRRDGPVERGAEPALGRTPSMRGVRLREREAAETPSSCAFSTPGERGEEACLDRQERADAPVDPERARVREQDARHEPQERRLPDPLGPMSARPSPGPAEKLTSRRPQASVTCLRSRATVDVTTRPLPSNWKRTPRPSATMAARFTRPPSRTAPARGGRPGR